MKLRLAVLIVGLIFVGLLVGAPQQDAYAGLNHGDIVPHSYLIQFDDSVTDVHGMAFGLANAAGAQVGHVYQNAVKGFSVDNMPEARLNQLLDAPGVVSVTPNRFVQVTKGGPPGGGGGSNPQVIPSGVARINGTATGTTNVDVAVVDTGVDVDHEDLNVVGGYNCSTGPTTGYDDGAGHGTHVAGTIGAVDNSVGVIGVAPGARIWAIRVLNNAGSGTWADVTCGIDWVAANASVIEVANMSLGGTGSDAGGCGGDTMHQAICNAVNAGVTFVVAAGNESDNSANHTPAAYDEVITVSALADFDGAPGGNGSPTCRSDVDDTFANFSNFGADVDIIAPGVCIHSTVPGGYDATYSGTSMASPHVAGAAALYLSTHAGASPAQVKNALQANGNTGWNNSDDGDNTKEKLLDVTGW